MGSFLEDCAVTGRLGEPSHKARAGGAVSVPGFAVCERFQAAGSVRVLLWTRPFGCGPAVSPRCVVFHSQQTNSNRDRQFCYTYFC